MRAEVRFLFVCALPVLGCATKFEPGEGGGAPDAGGNGAADAAPADPADAAPAVPDAAPLPKPYPPGPYGTGTGDTIENLAWQGFMDGADADLDHFNESARQVTLEDFFVERDPGAKLLVITNSAGWCGACQEEASGMPELDAQWHPRGVRFLTALIEDENGNPSPVAFAKDWGVYFDLTNPVVADPEYLLDPYYVDNAIPFNLFVETAGMTIVDKMSGWDEWEAEQIFETYTH